MDFAQFWQNLISAPEFAVPTGVEHFFVMVGVLMGAVYACEHKLDIIGTIAMGLLAGYGGGIIRDILLQNHGVYFMEHAGLILICVLVCVFVFYFHRLLKNTSALTFFLDVLSVALFAIAGVQKADDCGLGVVYAVMLGVITAVGGGALRDVASGETPSVFRGGNFYAVAALCGTLVFVILGKLGCPQMIAGILCVVVVVAIRYLSVYYNWRTKTADEVEKRKTARAEGEDKDHAQGKQGEDRTQRGQGERGRRQNPLLTLLSVFTHARLHSSDHYRGFFRVREGEGAQDEEKPSLSPSPEPPSETNAK